MDPVTLYVILMTASGTQEMLHQVSFKTMRECRAMAPSMRQRDWNIPKRGARVDVYCRYPRFMFIAR